jgi:hypothetical protein
MKKTKKKKKKKKKKKPQVSHGPLLSCPDKN